MVERDIMERLTVGEAMDPDPATVTGRDNLEKVLRAFAGCRSEMLPVVDTRGALQGVVRLSDLRPVLAASHAWRWLLVDDVMRLPPAALPQNASLLQAQGAFDATEAESLPVIEEGTGHLVGVANRHELALKAEEATAEWLAAGGRGEKLKAGAPEGRSRA